MKQSITCLLLCLAQFCLGQDMWINYTNTHRIYDFAEIDNGFWLGSEGGLCFYNTETGAETYYNRGNSNIPSNRVHTVLYKSEEEIWLATAGGLCLFDGDEFFLVPDKINGALRETLDDKLIVAGADSLYIQQEGMDFNGFAYPDYIAGIGGVEVHQETGAIYMFVNNWFAESYLAVLENGEWTVLFSDYIFDSSMTMDHDNKLWLINLDGLQYFEDGNWILVPEADLGEEIRYARLFVNTENQILILNQFECIKLSVWDGQKLEELDYTGGDCPQYDYFIKPSERENGVYYASQLYEGFYTFTENGIGDYKPLRQSPILHNAVINTLHPIDGGHIVIFYNGIQHIKSGDWNEISLPDDFSGRIKKGFLDQDDDLWIYNDEFMWSYKNEVWTKLLPPAEFVDIIDLMEIGANGDIWIQSELNIARYRDGEWEVFTTLDHDITSSIVKDMKVDPTNGDLWVATFQGVRQFDGQTWTTYFVEPINHTFGIAIGNGGAYVIANYNLRFLQNGVVDSISYPAEGDYNLFATKMIYDTKDDKLYMAGISSLAVFENEEWTVYDRQNSGHYHTLSNDVSIDNNDNIWLSGSRGGIGIFNSAGVSLSTDKEFYSDQNASFVKVYPTLLSQNRLFIVSEKSGSYQIVVSDSEGKIIYENQYRLLKNVPIEIELPLMENGLLFVTLSNGNQNITEKIIKIGE